MPDDVLVLGCGYAGVRLAGHLTRLGHRVTAVTRSRKHAARLRLQGLTAFDLDLDGPGSTRALRQLRPRACFCLVPPRIRAEAAVNRGPESRAARALQALAAGPLEVFVHVSSTAVYGDRSHAWVEEDAVPAPESEAACLRVTAEAEVLREGRRQGTRILIARVGGIYGPGRTPRRRLRAGPIPLIEGRQPWTNRIHVDDVASALATIRDRGEAGARYNVVDGTPHHTEDYLRLAGRLLEIAEPIRWISAEEARRLFPEERVVRMTASRRISNRRLRKLGAALRHQSFRTGLPAALDRESAAC